MKLKKYIIPLFILLFINTSILSLSVYAAIPFEPDEIGDYGNLKPGDQLIYQMYIDDALDAYLINKSSDLIDILNATDFFDYENATLFVNSLLGLLSTMQSSTINFLITNVTHPNATEDTYGNVEGIMSILGFNAEHLYNVLKMFRIINSTTTYAEFLEDFLDLVLNVPIDLDLVSFMIAIIEGDFSLMENLSIPIIMSNDWDYWDESLNETFEQLEMEGFNLSEYVSISGIVQNQTYNSLTQSFESVNFNLNISLGGIAKFLIETVFGFDNTTIEEIFASLDEYNDWLDCFHTCPLVFNISFEQNMGFLLKASISMNLTRFIEKWETFLTGLFDRLEIPPEMTDTLTDFLDDLKLGTIENGIHIVSYIPVSDNSLFSWFLDNFWLIMLAFIIIFGIAIGTFLLLVSRGKRKRKSKRQAKLKKKKGR